jgi:hypothetical protein
MSTRSRNIMFLRSSTRPMRKGDNHTAICGRLSKQCGIFNISQPYRPPRPVTGIALLFWDRIEYMNRPKQTNSMVWVRERTIPTERPPLVGEAIANFCGYRVPRGQRDGSLRPYPRFSRQEPLLFYQVAAQLYSRGWVDPVPDPLLFFW